MTILEQFYSGDINPSELYIKNDSKYQSISKQISEDVDVLMLTLNDNEKQLCEKIGENITELNYISEKDRFMEGFTIGAQMMWEVIYYKSENFYKPFNSQNTN